LSVIEQFGRIQKEYLRAYCNVQMWRSVQWNGVDFWQTPGDIVALAEAVHQSGAEAVVEVGVNAGGGLEFYNTILGANPRARIIGVDMCWAPREIVNRHPDRVFMILWDSAKPETASTVKDLIGSRRTMVILDSCHEKDHVAKELELYAPMVSPDSFLVVMDGVMKDLVGIYAMPEDAATNNPEAAVEEFLPRHPEFSRDHTKNRFGISFAPGGFLRKKE
jgi:cephalosporin hydroxylase